MPRKYRHMTTTGEFDEKAHIVSQAKEREKRGNVVFSRAERFNEVMSASEEKNARDAARNAEEQGFTSQYDTLGGVRQAEKKKKR